MLMGIIDTFRAILYCKSMVYEKYDDESEAPKMPSGTHTASVMRTVLFIVCLLTVANVLYLDITAYWNYTLPKPTIIQNIIAPPVSTTPAPSPQPTAFVFQECPQKCMKAIEESASTLKITLPVQPTITTTPTQITNNQVKEFFIPFGSGTSTAKDWQDVSGLQASVDSGAYGRIKRVTFEASVFIPTGNETAWVRLFNATDGHPVWSSDVSIDGGIAKLLTSQPITLDSGTKTYHVQMKTSLEYPANINQARIHILTY